jgi:predicted ribosome-associated RNA-binding protein Tma20
MIPKSMSRKDTSFYQLTNYFEKDDVQDYFAWNLYSNTKNKEEVIKEFMDNAELLKNARGSVYMYHEVLALQENDLSIERQKEILNDLAFQYVSKRANDNLVYGVIHEDTKHLHMHLMISSNKVGEQKRFRLSKSELANIQKEIEQYKNITYKDELAPTYHYHSKKEELKESMVEQEIKHRRKIKTKKDEIREKLEDIFDKSLSKSGLEKSLEANGFELYTRGKNTGVVFEKKKYRFNTLGVDKSYKQSLNKFEKRKQRQEKRQDFKESKGQRKVNTSSFDNKQEGTQNQSQRI